MSGNAFYRSKVIFLAATATRTTAPSTDRPPVVTFAEWTERSRAEKLASLAPGERKRILDGLGSEGVAELCADWRFWARPKQLPPPGNWSTWLLLAGRGFGKTRCGTGWVHERARDFAGRWMALIGKDPAEVRNVMIDGPAGLRRNAMRGFAPDYEPSKRRLTWPNGSWATIYSSEEPEELRGFSGDSAWADEPGKFRTGNLKAVWDNLQFGMREASTDRPRRVLTTTPKPIAQLREISALAGTVVVRGSSYENRANLDSTWFAETILPYEGTRLGRQEIHAELLDQAEGALWTRDAIEKPRLPASAELPALTRIVVAIDPAMTKGGARREGEDSRTTAEMGIVVAGTAANGRGYVLADVSAHCTPDDAARRAIGAYKLWQADRVIGEVNNGGDWIETVLRAHAPNVAYRALHASRGKQARAEPVAALYEQGRVHHVGGFPELEDQLCGWEPDSGQPSPDRLDALVWALTELMIEGGERRMIRFSGG